jgi:hypothetical protein
MKIELLSDGYFPLITGDKIDAAISPDSTQAFFFDSNGMGWYVPSCDFVKVPEEDYSKSVVSNGDTALAQLQRVSKNMTIEFKE